MLRVLLNSKNKKVVVVAMANIEMSLKNHFATMEIATVNIG